MFHAEQVPATLGIDIAKKTFQCALLKGGKYQHKAFTNDPKGFNLLSTWLNTQDVNRAQVCLEAPGFMVRR